MQKKDEKTLQLRKIIGEVITSLRKSKTNLTCNKMEDEYDFSKGSLFRIENAQVDVKIITLWKISESLGLKFSEFSKIVEEKLGKDFKLIDE